LPSREKTWPAIASAGFLRHPAHRIGSELEQNNCEYYRTKSATYKPLSTKVGDVVDDALDPSLTREEVIEQLQEIDGILGEDEDEEDEA